MKHRQDSTVASILALALMISGSVAFAEPSADKPQQQPQTSIENPTQATDEPAAETPPAPRISASPKAPAKEKAPKTASRKAGSRKSAAPKAAATSTASQEIPQLLREIEEKYSQASTLTAQFSQVTESAALGNKKTATGIVSIKRPDKVRWDTQKPDSNLVVSDGKKFWSYTPPFDEGERGQVIEGKSSQVRSRLATALLSGRFSLAKDMKITQESPNRFLLKPKRGSAGTVKQAEIQADPEKKLIEKVVLKHKDGNISEITFSNIELGKPLDDSLFHFVPPPNTDKVTE